VTAYLDPTNSSAQPVFCFHHAGGGSSLYQGWDRALNPVASAWPVLLPGRERRAREQRFVEIDALVADLDHQLGVFLSGPHVFFGHSMGALVAYRLACHRRDAGKSLPRALIVSAYPAPHLPAPFPPVDGIDDDQLAQVIEGIGGGAPDLPARWRDEMLAVARDDLRLCESHADSRQPPLGCPIHVFGGDVDPLVGTQELRAWEQHSDAEVDVHVLPGGHFYLRDAPEVMLRELRRLVRRYAEPRPVRWESSIW
jgi:surfactin synthase thioesterase subunit